MGHTSSADKMKELLDRYVPQGDPTRRVLEVGAAIIQDAYPVKDRYPPEAKVGGHRFDIEPPNANRGTYEGMDMAPGTNIDIVNEDPYHWPIEDETYDLVLSAQCLEHVEDLAAFSRECFRVIVPGGLTIHIAPSTGMFHQFPVHPWMIFKDGMKWLLEQGGFEVIEADHWDKHPWNDCWGVGRKPL